MKVIVSCNLYFVLSFQILSVEFNEFTIKRYELGNLPKKQQQQNENCYERNAVRPSVALEDPLMTLFIDGARILSHFV